jgi:hypothetical protein
LICNIQTEVAIIANGTLVNDDNQAMFVPKGNAKPTASSTLSKSQILKLKLPIYGKNLKWSRSLATKYKACSDHSKCWLHNTSSHTAAECRTLSGKRQADKDENPKVAKKRKSPKSKEDEEEVVEESNLTFEEVPDNLSL